MKYLSKAWKNMSEDQKERYKQISDQDRSRFDIERKELKSGKCVFISPASVNKELKHTELEKKPNSSEV